MSKDFDELVAKALAVRDRYNELNADNGHKKWDVSDYMAGFVGDVGDLSKLIMAKQGVRSGPADIDGALGHELADCLWSIMVIADELGIELETAFTKTMAELQTRLELQN